MTGSINIGKEDGGLRSKFFYLTTKYIMRSGRVEKHSQTAFEMGFW